MYANERIGYSVAIKLRHIRLNRLTLVKACFERLSDGNVLIYAVRG